jgi:hypothetical protein
MSDERFEQEEPKDETEDVEAHKKATMARKIGETEEPGTEQSDDVEAHLKRASHKSV